MSNTVVCNDVDNCDNGSDESVSTCGVKMKEEIPPPHYNIEESMDSSWAIVGIQSTQIHSVELSFSGRIHGLKLCHFGFSKPRD